MFIEYIISGLVILALGMILGQVLVSISSNKQR